MPLSDTDQLHLNTAAGFIQIGDAMAAWNELEEIDAKQRAATEVLGLRLDVCRKLSEWELAEEIARTLIKREPQSVMHVVALAEIMGKREGPLAAAAVYEFAIDRFPDFAPLRVSLAVELVKAGQVDDAKRVLTVAVQQDPQLRAVSLDHPGLEEVWQ
jgi:tetratricopeptide (TPR) repeat protein